MGGIDHRREGSHRGLPLQAVMADPTAIKKKGVTRRRFMGDVLKTAGGVDWHSRLSQGLGDLSAADSLKSI